jgi:hypothetical protein
MRLQAQGIKLGKLRDSYLLLRNRQAAPQDEGRLPDFACTGGSGITFCCAKHEPAAQAKRNFQQNSGGLVVPASHFAAQNMSLQRKLKEIFSKIQGDLWLRHHILLRKI